MNAITKLMALVPLLFLFACGGGSGSGLVGLLPPPPVVDPVDPVFSAGSFTATSTEVDNPYFPLTPGRTYIFEGGTERVEVSVSHDTRTVLGIETVVVLDRAFDEGELVEETFDWYAQDSEGNVWYMGEDSKELEDGEIVSTAGSWEAGQDIDATGANAVAGIQMKVAPFTVGDTYLQEFYATVAEDTAEIVALDVDISVSNVLLPEDGMQSMFTTLHTLERNPLAADPVSTEEFKYFAPGFGLVLETDTSGMERIELIEVLDDTLPDIDPQNFSNSTIINNKYFPLVPGTTYRFETTVGADQELVIVEVLPDTRFILGITTVVVRDRVYINGDENTGLLLEDTEDWYAQDDNGNVWYMGEFVQNFDEDSGAFLENDGSWEAGIDGAVPGIQMKANPRTGDSYRQEYSEGSAEDLAVIVDSDVEIMLADGTTYSTFKIKEWNPLEEDSTEFKYYAAGVGFIREEKLDEAGEVAEAVELTGVEIGETFEHFELAVENNVAEGEAQVIVSGSVEPIFLKSLSCFAPNGATLVDLGVADNSGDYADFQYDTAKTELAELELSHPIGTYWCIATTPDDGMLLASAAMNYDLTDSVVPSAPANGSTDIPASGVIISWTAVDNATAIAIDVENLATGVSLEVDLAGDATSFTIPDDVLEEGTEYAIGFEATSASGNRSVTEDYGFTTTGVPVVPDADDETFGDFKSLGLFVVYNDTDVDAQVIIEAEALDDTVMTSLTIFAPNGEIIHEASFSDNEDLGITDVLYESSEPGIAELELDFPAGEYTLAATFINGLDEEVEGTGPVTLAYEVLSAPTITFPLEGALGIVASNPLTITWTGIDPEVDTIILELEADGSGETYGIEFDVGETEFTIPANWMLPDTDYVIDLEVVHENGNFTVVDTEFLTEP